MKRGVEVKGLLKQIDHFEIGPVDLDFEPGTITALVGKNGAGKSTFAKLLMNLAKRDRGEIFLEGQPVSSSSEEWKTKIAYQPQVLLGCNAFNGCELKKLISSLYPTWDEELFIRLVEVFKIPLDKPYGSLSPGVQQQLNFVLSLPRDTDILLLDEPTAHMDIHSKQLVQDELATWMERGEKTMILVSHQVEDIRKLADFIVVFQEGKILAHAAKDGLTQNYKRYWLELEMTDAVPGEIARKNGRIIVTNQSVKTEQFFLEKGIRWTDSRRLELEEIISMMIGSREGV